MTLKDREAIKELQFTIEDIPQPGLNANERAEYGPQFAASLV
jgi:hypothetical protein